MESKSSWGSDERDVRLAGLIGVGVTAGLSVASIVWLMWEGPGGLTLGDLVSFLLSGQNLVLLALFCFTLATTAVVYAGIAFVGIHVFRLMQRKRAVKRAG